jgi:hypothetical protein
VIVDPCPYSADLAAINARALNARIRRAMAGVRHPLAVAIGRWWGR